MKKIISPSQPHFFKAILPGFMDGLKIPISFSKYSGTGDGFSGEALLIRRPGGKEWWVEMEEGVFRGGWSTFARDNNLKPGNFVICQIIRKMVFRVHVLDDATQCEFPEPEEVVLLLPRP